MPEWVRLPVGTAGLEDAIAGDYQHALLIRSYAWDGGWPRIALTAIWEAEAGCSVRLSQTDRQSGDRPHVPHELSVLTPSMIPLVLDIIQTLCSKFDPPSPSPPDERILSAMDDLGAAIGALENTVDAETEPRH